MATRIDIGTGVTTITGDNTSFSLSFNKEEANLGIHGIAKVVNRKSREFIKECLKKGANDADRIITGKSVKENLKFQSMSQPTGKGTGNSAPELIGSSLGYGFRFALKDRIEYVAGSYDRDENLDPVTRKSTLRQPPTGVRASSMNKNDISLTQIYENTQGPFQVTGVISNPSETGGFVKDGVVGAEWKKKQERMGKVLYAMKGYGAGMKRKGKPAPKIQRRGFKGLKTMAVYERAVRKHLNDTREFVNNVGLTTEGEVTKEGRQATLREF